MALDGPTATIVAALIAATVIFIVTGFNITYRLGKLEKGAEDMEKTLAKAAEDTEKALVKAATDTEKALVRVAEDTEKALVKAATDTQKALEKVATDTQKSLEKSATDTDKALEKAAADTDRRFERLEETMRVEHEATRAEIRRVVEAIASHTHDADGTTIFRIPPG